MLKYIFAAGTAFIAVSLISLIWPKLTTKPRPPILGVVRDNVVQTSLGHGAASVLGVSDENKVEPVNIASATAGIVNSIKGFAQDRVRQVATVHAVRQLSQDFDRLPTSEQEKIREIICKP